MFDIAYHNSLVCFQKLGYISTHVGLSHAEVADIIGADSHVVSEILDNGFLTDSMQNAENVSEDLYLLGMLFSTLLRLGKYDTDRTIYLLQETSEFNGCIEKPPWYIADCSLQCYLLKEKMNAVRKSLHWLDTH